MHKKWLAIPLGGIIVATLSAFPAVGTTFAALVTCASTTPCDGGNNTSTGPGVQGTSAKGNGIFGSSTSAVGVSGKTTGTAAGVSGYSSGASSNIHTLGVYGYSSNVGVGGGSSNIGVQGQGNTSGVQGISPNGSGVFGYGAIGVQAVGTEAVVANGTSIGVSASGRGEGLFVFTTDGTTGDGVFSHGGDTGVYSKGGRYGVTGFGDTVGVTGQNGGVNGTAVLARDFVQGGGVRSLYRGQDGKGSDVFTVDDLGNIYAKGQVSATAFVTHAAATVAQTTSNGSRVTTFAAQQTAPSVEHVGEANLVAGSAIVRFDAAFAATMAHGPYMVFITPQGETRGLYVSQKTANGFVVRESQLGRSNVAFDYRVVARPYSSSLHTDLNSPRAWPYGPPIQHPPKIRKHIRRVTMPRTLVAPQ